MRKSKQEKNKKYMNDRLQLKQIMIDAKIPYPNTIIKLSQIVITFSI